MIEEFACNKSIRKELHFSDISMGHTQTNKAGVEFEEISKIQKDIKPIGSSNNATNDIENDDNDEDNFLSADYNEKKKKA